MLEVTVQRIVTRPTYQVFEMQVQLNGADRLTPKSARAALEVAFGNSSSGIVFGDDGYGYKVYPNSTRKIHTDPVFGYAE